MDYVIPMTDGTYVCAKCGKPMPLNWLAECRAGLSTKLYEALLYRLKNTTPEKVPDEQQR